MHTQRQHRAGDRGTVTPGGWQALPLPLQSPLFYLQVSCSLCTSLIDPLCLCSPPVFVCVLVLTSSERPIAKDKETQSSWCESQLIIDTRNTGRRQLCLDSLKSIPDVSFWHHQGEQEIGKHPVITRVLELFCVLNSTMTRTELVPRPWLGPGLSCIVILLWVKVLDVSGWVVWQQWRLTPVLDTRMVDIYIFISIEVITRFIYLLLLLILSLTASLNAVIFPSLPPKCWD